MTADAMPIDHDDDRWRHALQADAGVLHRREIPVRYERRVRREIRTRRWQRVSRDVFVIHNGPLSPVQRRLVALKAAPPGSALSGPTAATIDGLRGFPSDDVHVTLPCGSRSLTLPGVVAHFSRFLSEEDVHPLKSPRRTRPARSLLDAASWANDDLGARAIILAGVQQGLASPVQLRDALGTRGPCLRHALIDETISDAAGGISSVPEREFTAIIRAYCLPEPVRQRVIRHPSGRYYLDTYWEAYDLAAEVDGLHHMDVQSWNADLDRTNEIVIERRTLLRFTSYAIRRNAPAIGATLARALIARGWNGSRLTIVGE